MAKQPPPPTGDDDLRIMFDHDGRTYDLRLMDFSGEDDLAVYREVGLSIFDIFGGQMTLFTIAALLWRHRVNHGESDLAYATVNKSLSFAALETIRDASDEPKAAGEGSAPEASGGS